MSQTTVSVKLPSALPGNLDLEAINKRLREGEAQLDWSGVETASEEALAILLDGLDLADDADTLGVESEMSDHIADSVANFLKHQNSSRKQKRKNKKDATNDKSVPQATPRAWVTPPPKSEKLFAEERSTAQQINFASDDAPAETPSQPPAASVSSTEKISTLNIPSAYELRAKLETAILNDLLGPAGGAEEEVFEQNVTDRYLVGMLAPQHRRSDPELLKDELPLAGTDTTQDGKVDPGVSLARTMLPSSIGMTFSISGEAKLLSINASWGHYEREKSKTVLNADGSGKTVWKRYPIEETSPPIKLAEGKLNKWTVHPDHPDVYVQGLVRRQDSEWIVSLFIVNAGREPDRPRPRDTAWVFQPELSVECVDEGRRDSFLRRPCLRRLVKGDPVAHAEDKAVQMLYRKQIEFAVGHGVSIHAEVVPDNSERATRISTRVVPAYEVPKTTPPTAKEIPALTDLVLDMKELAEVPDSEISAKLNALPLAYEAWIKEQAQRLDDNNESLSDFTDVAASAIESCKTALKRIREGLSLLKSDPVAAESFRFMNRAMWKQRTHSILSEGKRRGDDVSLDMIDVPRNRTWYPFQLAFILLNLPSLTDLSHEDRCHETNAIADLLWFPTGGGKTEAYLGLTAYTLAMRRLQGKVEGRSGEHGVAVLMRYTLRLLTLQQFQRASALICACESIRRELVKSGDARWGNEPFRIGLWVGEKTTPNKTEQSEEFTRQIRGQFYQGASGSPHQLTNCPWCGHKIDQGQHIKVESVSKGRGRTIVYCGDPNGRCEFTARHSPSEGLPILVVDEEIYRRLPSLLIATVDKFAQMPWKGATGMLFGQVSGYCARHGFTSPEIKDTASHNKTSLLPAVQIVPHNPLRPPDLIIQDELHLISGPLGTLVGLYETAVDKLASWNVNGKRVRPKVVASTATIRQAGEQIRSLFLRRVNLFPPQGLDASDNFFSRQRNPSAENPGRRYLGICASGRRLKVALLRVYIAQLAASQALYNEYGAHADPWMTTVGYFNSLRELGGMRRLVDDDVRARLGKMDQRGLASRKRIYVEELTSRKSSTDIPHVLDRLETGFDPVRLAEIEWRKKNNQKVDALEPLDVLLATNMISVGVDVKRLGAMVVAGQPKTTAEYIQATSRVGRSFPGLVLTVYNWARPRDLSHYETFEHYHATFYQHVEALSVTPFSSGATYRGLAALLVTLVRLSGGDFNENKQAANIERDHPYVQAAVKTILDRAAEIGGGSVRDHLSQEIAQKLDFWLDVAHDREGGRALGYKSQRDGITMGLLKDPYGLRWEDFTCLQSLRNVEPTAGLILYDNVIDEEAGRLPRPATDSVADGETAKLEAML